MDKSLKATILYLALLPMLALPVEELRAQQILPGVLNPTPAASGPTPGFVQACPASASGGGSTDLVTTCTGVTSGDLGIFQDVSTASQGFTFKNNYSGTTTCASSSDTIALNGAWYATNVGKTASTVFGTTGNSTNNLCLAGGYYGYYQVFEFSHAGGGLDGSAVQVTGTASSFSIPITTTVANDLWFVIENDVGGGCAASSGATGAWFGGATGYIGCTNGPVGTAIAYGVFPSAGSNTIAVVLHGSTTYYASALPYKAN